MTMIQISIVISVVGCITIGLILFAAHKVAEKKDEAMAKKRQQ